MEHGVFTDRAEAGRMLANELRSFEEEQPIVIALPRGGVPVGFEIAMALKAPLDVVIVRKIGAPFQPEYGIGAMAEDGTYWINSEAAEEVGAVGPTLQEITNRESQEIRRRVKAFRSGGKPVSIAGRVVILTDDGLATGVTARVAARYLRHSGAKKIILAVPVCPSETAEALQTEVDEVICLKQPAYFFAIGDWYEDFTQLTDEQVLALLSDARAFAQDKSKEEKPMENCREVYITGGARGLKLPGDLVIPSKANGLVLFAHGSGSSRKSPRNMQVARTLNQAGLATLLFDLLTPR